MTITKSLKATKRLGTGKGAARKLRQSGRVPAVLYGSGMDALHLTLDAMEVEHLFAAISVENTIVELDIEGEKQSHQTLVREIQAHPVRNSLVHVDFLRIQKGVAVDVEVPVHLVGTPIGVKQHGGVLEQIIHEIEVRCIPSMIPESFEVDVSGLDIDDAIRVSDLEFEEGVVPTVEKERTVCLVAAPRAAAAEGEAGEMLEPGEAAEPEVIGESERDED